MSDETKPYVPKIDRRTALLWVGAVGAAAAAGGAGVEGHSDRNQPEAKG